MSKLVSCSTGTQTPLISSCLSSVVSGNWGEEGTWQGDMFEPSFEGNHVQVAYCSFLSRLWDAEALPEVLTVAKAHPVTHGIPGASPSGRRGVTGTGVCCTLCLVLNKPLALYFWGLTARPHPSDWAVNKQAGKLGWGLLVVESWRVESRLNGCDCRQGYRDGVAASASSVLQLLWERSAGICQSSQLPRQEVLSIG